MCETETCPGCGCRLDEYDGPTHRYMTSTPECWHAFSQLLSAEYSSPELMITHRLSVDTYAVQHPGDDSRQAIQSVGLHLARLMVQLDTPRLPHQTNKVMQGFAKHKASLARLTPPASFSMTIADIVPFIGTDTHAAMVKKWAQSTWQDWHLAHDYIRNWAENR